MITATVLEYLTVKAIGGNTLAQEISTAPIDTLDDGFASISHPTLAIVVGDDIRPEITGKEVTLARREISLTFQIFCPERVSVQTGVETLEVGTRNRGGGSLIIGMLGRQIERRLMADQDPAAVLWREFVMDVKSITSQPYIFEVQKGVRILAQEIEWVLDTIAEPAFGQPTDPTLPWGKVLAMLEADPDYAPLASWIRAEINSPSGMTAARVAAAALGLNDASASNLGFGAVLPDLAGEDPADLASVVLFGDVLDEDRVNEIEPDETP